MSDPKAFTTPELAEIIGVPQRKLLSYIERGYASPSIQEASGHGSKRLWSFRDVIHCAVIKHLLYGFSVENVRVIAGHLLAYTSLSQDEVLFIPFREDLQKAMFIKVSVDEDQDPYSYIEPEDREEYPLHLLIRFQDIFAWVDQRLDSR